ncbi:hypothetical protein J6590_076576 [Homalodisca vitripennis]|nr:hypothetical protein J6590_076576 [Homalodisca vitripennis]
MRKYNNLYCTIDRYCSLRTLDAEMYANDMSSTVDRYCSLGTLTSEEGGESEQLRPYYNTICDPNFPLFHRSGLPASQALYDSRVTHHYRELSEETNQGKKVYQVIQNWNRSGLRIIATSQFQY